MKRITFIKSCTDCYFRLYHSAFENECLRYLQPIEFDLLQQGYMRCEGCREDFPSGHIKITMEEAGLEQFKNGFKHETKQLIEPSLILTENNVRIDQHIIHEENPDEIWVVREIKSGHNIVIERWGKSFTRKLLVPAEFKNWRIKE